MSPGHVIVPNAWSIMTASKIFAVVANRSEDAAGCK
jgi:hypothetical protein